MELFNPKTGIPEDFDVLGTGTVIWFNGFAKDEFGEIIFPVQLIDEKAMGIWAVGGRFFRVKSEEGDNHRELNKQVKEGVLTVLEREFKVTARPEPNETTDMFGSCPDRTQGVDKGMVR
jgi:hypothetical protein